MGEGYLNVSPNDHDCFWRVDVPDAEPWIFSCGFISDLQKVLCISTNVADLMTFQTVLPISLNCFTIRPYMDEDQNNLRYIDQTADEEEKLTCNVPFPGDIRRQRFFDKNIGTYVSCAIPRTSFVVVENDAVGNPRRIIAVVSAALDAREFVSKWQRQLEDVSRWVPPLLSESFYKKFPSQVDIKCHDFTQDATAVRRLLCVTAVALAYNGK
ncbi:unnamed protein product [Gongylonema pulchrum]|uniref:FBA_1 domain-containing protein n=1 Tax=Gongylonema pulchrum TaxID=637853 RepID=A0A183EDV1_9BILA|nr:unnamed protein product [Gongylonema pulchrum]